MNHEKEMKFFKRTLRFIGLYCLTLILGLFGLAITAPNGVDHGIHLYLTIIWGLMFAMPILLGVMMWLYFEFYGYKRVRFSDDDTR